MSLDDFVACSAAAAAAAAVGSATQQSDAAIVYSGVVKRPIRTRSRGLHERGAAHRRRAIRRLGVNPYYNAGLLNSTAGNGTPGGANDTRFVVSGRRQNLPPGTLISQRQQFQQRHTHSRPRTALFTPARSILGFRFFNEADTSTHTLGPASITTRRRRRRLVNYAWRARRRGHPGRRGARPRSLASWRWRRGLAIVRIVPVNSLPDPMRRSPCDRSFLWRPGHPYIRAMAERSQKSC